VSFEFGFGFSTWYKYSHGYGIHRVGGPWVWKKEEEDEIAICKSSGKSMGRGHCFCRSALERYYSADLWGHRAPLRLDVSMTDEVLARLSLNVHLWFTLSVVVMSSVFGKFGPEPISLPYLSLFSLLLPRSLTDNRTTNVQRISISLFF
jgi:hypothetical protein